MATDITNLIVRNPRHNIADNSSTQIEIRRGEATDVVLGQLADLSRNGMQVLTAASLTIGESVSVRLVDTRANIDERFKATVQWQREVDDTGYAVGCLLVEEVDWIVLGELFLNGILIADLPTDEDTNESDSAVV